MERFTFLETLLDEIERREARRLVWGLVDGYLSENELHALIAPVLDKALEDNEDLEFTSERAVIDHLMKEGILHKVMGHDGYRSRMAEGVRLFSRLRQLLPKHASGSDWISAPTLVSDYRFIWRRRRYPSRGIKVAEALHQWRSALASAPAILGTLGARVQRFNKPGFGFAAFQIDATERILEGLVSGRPQGTLISAGTGSGKTLAFYLPTLSWLATSLATNSSLRVRAIAIYPRNELLKDQFSEVYKQAREFDDILRAQGLRPLRIGALFSDVPRNARAVAGYEDRKPMWKPSAAGFICPFLRCPTKKCQGELLWTTEDHAQEIERLCCSVCGHVVDDKQVVLTRRRMQSEPPDVLFTTSEMLNRRMSDSESRHLFGIGAKASQGPDLVLLDEVHLYSGSFGAHIGYLLRRWRSQVKAQPHFVGLSATLRSGPEFFAKLTGLAEVQVAEIAPRERDLEAKGAEYLLALCGDPVSRRALLSTTIQTIMLVARLLDLREKADERQFYGWRTFVFTDQMDSVNRLLAKTRDAEGRYDESGDPNTTRHPEGGLAILRRSRSNIPRYEGGQDWGFIDEVIGNELGIRLRISRTTSMDRGVDADSEVVLATASLEVGYDDPQVGAVVQHKAPRDVAQFLQRKGRAGRTREIRPWTIVVLSDYGRDRLAYQAYDQLFDPELPPRSLPLQNRYVQRIQAVFALLEYLEDRLPPEIPAGSTWRDLTGPTTLDDSAKEEAVRALWRERAANLPMKGAARSALVTAANARVHDWRVRYWIYSRERRALHVEQLQRLSNEPSALDDLARSVQRRLGLSDSETQSIMWDYPRPLALGVVPTAMRRLATSWRAHDSSGEDYQGDGPLPDFAPSQLFGDLNLPEVKLEWSVRGTNRRPRAGSGFLPVRQALNEFAPGKVSWRYDSPLWVAPAQIDIADHQNRLELSEFFECEAAEPFSKEGPDGVELLPAFRPVLIRLSPLATGTFQDTSNARLVWHTQIAARAQAATLEVTQSSSVNRLIRRIRFHSHSQNSPVLVRRYASASLASLRRPRKSDSQDIEFTFSYQGRPCVMGFEFEADGVAFELSLPGDLATAMKSFPHAARALRVSRFNDEVRHGGALSLLVPNPFQREWLASVFITAVTLEAYERQHDLKRSTDAVVARTATIQVDEILDSIFQSPAQPDVEDAPDSMEDRLRQDLQHFLMDPGVLRALGDAAGTLWAQIDDSWNAWLHRTAKETLGGALIAAIGSLCPDLDTEGLIVDLDPGPRLTSDPYAGVPAEEELWITEVAPGGNGLLEHFVARYVENPTRLLELIEAGIGPNEHEVADQQLALFVRLLGGPAPDVELKGIAMSVRNASSTAALEESFARLRRQLALRGFSVFHGFAVALNARLLRAGTPPDLDPFLDRVLQHWEAMEQTLGVEVDSRNIAYLASRDDAIDQVLATAGFDPPERNRRSWRFNALYSMLWPRGPVIREAGVQFNNPYVAARPAPERLLLQALIEGTHASIPLENAGWAELFAAALRTTGVAVLSADNSGGAAVAGALNYVALEPVSLDYLNVYPRLVRITRHAGRVLMRFEIAEAL